MKGSRSTLGIELTGFFLLCAIYLVLVIPFFPVTLDDIFITFRYGKNLGLGNGLVWNAGEPPVEGYTTFLWMLLGALAKYVSPLLVAKCLTIGSVLASIVVIIFWFEKFLPNYLDRFVLAMLFITSFEVVYYSAGGMEHIVVACLMIALYGVLINLEKLRPVLAAVLVGILTVVMCLLRPEGHAIGIILFMRYFILGLCLHRGNLRAARVYGLILLIFLAPYHVGRYLYFGDLLPNTFYAKHTGGSLFHTLLGGIMYAGAEGAPYVVFLVLTFLASFDHLNRFQKRNESPALNYLSAFIAGSFCLYLIVIGGDDRSFPGIRLALPALPVLMISSTTYLSRLLEGQKKQAAALLLIVTVFFAMETPVFFSNVKAMLGANNMSRGLLGQIVSNFKVHLRELQYPEPKPFSKYLMKVTPKGETIAVPWAGLVPYETMLPVIDLLGLNNRHIAKKQKNQMGIDVKYDADYVIKQYPYFICENFVFSKVHKMSHIKSMSESELYAAGAWKIGQRNLLKHPILHEYYEVAEGVPHPYFCFERTKKPPIKGSWSRE